MLLGAVLSCYGICGLCALVGALVLLLSRNRDITFLLIACLIATFATAWFEIKPRLQLAELHDADYFRMSSVRGLITMALVGSVAYLVRSPPVIVLALAASDFCASFAVRDRRLRLHQCRFDLTVCKRLFRFGFPLSVSVGLDTILMAVDKWLLQGPVRGRRLSDFSRLRLLSRRLRRWPRESALQLIPWLSGLWSPSYLRVHARNWRRILSCCSASAFQPRPESSLCPITWRISWSVPRFGSR